MGTAINRSLFLNAMADYSAAAMATTRSKRLNGTLKRIEYMFFPLHFD